MADTPLFTFKSGIVRGLQVAVWPPTNGTMKVTVQKRYRTKDGQWKSTNTLFPNELPAMKEAIETAMNWLNANHPGSLERKKKDGPAEETETEAQPLVTSTKPFNSNIY